MMARRNLPVPADRAGRSASQPTGLAIMLAAALLALAAAAASIIALALAAIVVGLALAPAITSIALGVNHRAPPPAITEAFAWISFATPCGGAAGQALAGTLAAGPGPRWGFIEAAAGASIAAVLAAAAWHGQQTPDAAQPGATRPPGPPRCSRAASGAGR
jgi:MFS family permease